MNEFFNIPSLHLWQFVSAFLFTLLTGLVGLVYWLWGIVDKRIEEGRKNIKDVEELLIHIKEKMIEICQEIKKDIENLQNEDEINKIHEKIMKINIRVDDIYKHFLNIPFRNQREIEDIDE